MAKRQWKFVYYKDLIFYIFGKTTSPYKNQTWKIIMMYLTSCQIYNGCWPPGRYEEVRNIKLKNQDLSTHCLSQELACQLKKLVIYVEWFTLSTIGTDNFLTSSLSFSARYSRICDAAECSCKCELRSADVRMYIRVRLRMLLNTSAGVCWLWL
jgi:hypothetical protein